MRRATLFGKLPAHGDFVARGWTGAERDALDRWLAGSLADARDALGAAFEPTYDQAPPWRFAWRGEGAWQAGAMAPSMDGVGRRYPVVAGLDGLAEDEVAAVAEALEQLLYAALGEGWDADRLAGAIATVAPVPGKAWTGGDCWWTLGGGTGTHHAFLEDEVTGARPAGLMRAVLTLSEMGREEMA